MQSFYSFVAALLLLFASFSWAETPEDGSLTVTEYKARGFPELNRGWSFKDCAQAIKVLIVVSEEDPTLLPRAAESNSSKVFAKLVEWRRTKTEKQTLGRMELAVQTLELLNLTHDIYMAAGQRSGSMFDDEHALLASRIIEEMATIIRFQIELAKTDAEEKRKLGTLGEIVMPTLVGAIFMVSDPTFEESNCHLIALSIETGKDVITQILEPTQMQYLQKTIKKGLRQRPDSEFLTRISSVLQPQHP